MQASCETDADDHAQSRRLKTRHHCELRPPPLAPSPESPNHPGKAKAQAAIRRILNTARAMGHPIRHLRHDKFVRCGLICGRDIFVDMNSTARTLLIVILILFLVGLLPTWPYSTGWGYYPVGGVGLLLMIVIALLLLGKL